MSDGRNFERLRDAIMPLSRATEWDTAKLEWELFAVTEADEPETCPCGHHPIRQLCTIRNRLTEAQIEVGNVCVNKFIGLNSAAIFASLRKINGNISATLGSDALVFFHQARIISDWEYGFSVDTLRKRNLSTKQNKVLAAVRRAKALVAA